MAVDVIIVSSARIFPLSSAKSPAVYVTSSVALRGMVPCVNVIEFSLVAVVELPLVMAVIPGVKSPPQHHII